MPRRRSASSVEDNNFPPSNAIDGNSWSRWSSVFSDPQWIALDIGTSANELIELHIVEPRLGAPNRARSSSLR